ncbi:predicted protein [Naegleria gruberi]|uniref:Predicted protein n=1 Tax=Naegleria gruberi TaxID=5762 RepID=D2VXV4_NAEGR|nr:uncharacterized protein NAEGRDRAFT_73889 [Naegleria gruberi]EFC38406.1 predicted protein [Naegleria gruberi]|eukprot:XP_002671150.1 predicted protein [Naegleria gruberi strain NEG-M]
MKYSILLSLLILCSVLLLNCQVTIGQEYETHAVPVTQDYSDAIDAATQEMITDTTFMDAFFKLMYFQVPQCTYTPVSWPTKNPFTDRTGLVMCIDLGGLGYPFQDARLLVANTLVKKINNHYGSKLQTYVKYVNTTALGFFDTMKNAVNSGICDVISVNVEQNDARRKAVHFQCPWGTTSKAFLRTELDPQLELSTYKSLNQSNVIVATYAGTTYEIDVKTNLPAAQYISFGTPETQWKLILDKKVHAVVYNAVTFLSWLDSNRANCKNCSVVFINQPYAFSTFTTMNITARNDASTTGMSVVNIYWIFAILFYFLF